MFKMKNICKKLSLFMSLFLIFNLVPCVLASNLMDEIKDRGYIRVSTNAEFEPFEYKDGDSFSGIDIDIAEKIAESLGVKAIINDTSFDAVTLELANKSCDFAISAMSYSEDRSTNVDFSDVYYIAKQAVLVPNSSDISKGDDLHNQKIGVALGFTGDIYCTEHFPDSEIFRYNKCSDAVSDLVSGRLDAVVVDEAPAKKLIRLSNDKVKMLDDYLFEEGYRIAVPKGETELLDYINLQIGQLKDGQEIEKISNKYVNSAITPSVDIVAQIYNNLKYKDRYKMLLDGLYTTFKITVVAILIGISIGLICSVVRVSRSKNILIKLLKFIANLYITVIRGTPVVVQLFVVYYLILASTGLDKVIVAMIAFGINSGAYVAEHIRSGINAIDVGQYEAGRSLGLGERATMTKIILPQALKNVLPTLVNEFIQLIKETSVAGFIGVMDLSKAGDIIRSQTYEPLVPLTTVALTYLIIVMVTTLLMSILERKLKKSDKR